MSIELSGEQRAAVARGEPVRVSEADADLVILRADVYERLAEGGRGEFDPGEAYPLVDLIMADDDANDPHLGKTDRKP